MRPVLIADEDEVEEAYAGYLGEDERRYLCLSDGYCKSDPGRCAEASACQGIDRGWYPDSVIRAEIFR